MFVSLRNVEERVTEVKMQHTVDEMASTTVNRNDCNKKKLGLSRRGRKSAIYMYDRKKFSTRRDFRGLNIVSCDKMQLRYELNNKGIYVDSYSVEIIVKLSSTSARFKTET